MLAITTGELCTAVILIFGFEAAKVYGTFLRKINRTITAVRKSLLEGCGFLVHSEFFQFQRTKFSTEVVE